MSTVELALGRVEGGRLVRNPAVWLAFAMSGLWLGAAYTTDNAEDRYNVLLGYALIVPGLVMLFHVGLATLRGRMSGTEELFETLPVSHDRRTVGHGLSTVGAAALAFAFIGVAIALLRPSSALGEVRWLRRIEPLRWELFAIPRPNVAQIIQGPLAVVVVSCLAIALVRWIPSWAVLLVFVVMASMQLTVLGLWYGTSTSVVEWLFPMPTGIVQDGWYGTCSDEPPAYCDLVVSGFDRTTPWWHAAYLVALAVWLVTIAVLRHRRDRTTWTAFGAASVAVVTLAVAQLLVFETYDLPVPA
jgi:hypothetical protein